MAFYRERDLKNFIHEVTTEGIGTGGGLVVGGLIGNLVESKLVPVEETYLSGSMLRKLAAWATNNGAKAVLYGLSKRYGSDLPMAKDATKALAGSVVYDTIIRLSNGGNPLMPGVFVGGYRILGAGANSGNVQKLVQENSILRTELNKALQKLAGANTYPPSPTLPGTQTHPPGMKPNQGLSTEALPYPGTITQNPPPNTPTTAAREWQDYRAYVRQTPYRADSSADFRYAGAPSPAVEQRQTRYGAMPFNPNDKTGYPYIHPGGSVSAAAPPEVGGMPWTPDVMERQRRYGAMPFEQSHDVIRREHKYGQASPSVGGLPYGAMPFEQNTEKTNRQRYFGQMQDPQSTALFETYGMK